MIRLILLTAALASFACSALAADKEEAEAAFNAAQAAEADAFAAKAAWIPTETALASAKAALAAGKWDEAKAFAEQAQALAVLSVEQANEQKTSWRTAVFH